MNTVDPPSRHLGNDGIPRFGMLSDKPYPSAGSCAHCQRSKGGHGQLDEIMQRLTVYLMIVSIPPTDQTPTEQLASFIPVKST